MALPIARTQNGATIVAMSNHTKLRLAWAVALAGWLIRLSADTSYRSAESTIGTLIALAGSVAVLIVKVLPKAGRYRPRQL
jgi:hypothetical protein